MKKILNLFLSLTSITIVSFNSLVVVSCGTDKPVILTQNDYANIYKKYFYGYVKVDPKNPYYSFINHYIAQTNRPAKPDSIKAFDNLQINPIWNSFQELQTDLTSTKLSYTVTINVNWNELYNKVKLDKASIDKVDALQLSFYNSIAKVYQKNNILHLLQKINVAPIDDDKTIAYNTYYPAVGSQTQAYGKNFVNQTLINQQYNANFWNSNHLNAVSIHEYGHALSNYINFPTQYRSKFNTFCIPKEISKQNMLSNRSAYCDITQVLMDYLDTKITITSTNSDDAEIKNFLFPLIVVKSGYSTISFQTGNPSERNEFLAEAFSLWLGTDKDKRTWSWELLNDFFMNYLPKYGNLN